MSMKQKYFTLQLKRRMLKCPAVLAVSFFIMCVALVCGSLLMSAVSGGEKNAKINVGIVGNASDSYLGVGIHALQNIDSSRFTVNFEEMNEEDAKEKLLRDELDGYLAIPDSFIKDILKGKNTPATYYIRKSALNFGSVVTGEITQTVSSLVTETQSAIYSMHSVAENFGKEKNLSKKTEKLNIKYINTVLSRESAFDIKTVGAADNVSYGGYYLCAIVLVFMILGGIFSGVNPANKSDGMNKLLKSRGVSAMHQIWCEYASYLIFSFVMLVLLIFAFLVLSSGRLLVDELKGFSYADTLAISIKLFPVVMMVCALHTLIYEISGNTVGAVLMIFLTAVCLGYISGFFYPDSFFPDSIKLLGKALPSGVGFAYMRKMLSGMNLMRDMLGCTAYTVIFVIASAFVRNLRMSGGDNI